MKCSLKSWHHPIVPFPLFARPANTLIEMYPEVMADDNLINIKRKHAGYRWRSEPNHSGKNIMRTKSTYYISKCQQRFVVILR